MWQRVLDENLQQATVPSLRARSIRHSPARRFCSASAASRRRADARRRCTRTWRWRRDRRQASRAPFARVAAVNLRCRWPANSSEARPKCTAAKSAARNVGDAANDGAQLTFLRAVNWTSCRCLLERGGAKSLATSSGTGTSVLP